MDSKRGKLSIIVIAILIIPILSAVLSCTGSPADGSVTNLTSTRNTKYHLQLWDNRVVFYQKEGWSNNEIIMYDIETGAEKKPTTDDYSQINPDIYGDTVVYMDHRDNNDWEIYVYDIGTGAETRLTNNNDNDMYPAVWGDMVVFTRSYVSGDEIVLHYLTNGTERILTSTSYVMEEADIWGDVIVWMDNRNGNFDIYGFSLSNSSEWQLTSDSGSQSSPSIYYDKVVWNDYRNFISEVYIYDIRTGVETRLTWGSAYKSGSSMFRDRVVYYEEDLPSSSSSVKMLDLTENSTVTVYEGSTTIRDPKINNERIVWREIQNGYWNIFHTYIDQDGDGTFDWDDAFPRDPTEVYDFDSDGTGDVKDHDDDGDGHPDIGDAFPFNKSEWLDSDLDGLGNDADLDDDNDGIPDLLDEKPLDPTNSLYPKFMDLALRLEVLEMNLTDQVLILRENLTNHLFQIEDSIIGRLNEIGDQFEGQVFMLMMEIMGRLDQINITISTLIMENWETYHAVEQDRLIQIMEGIGGIDGRTHELEAQITTGFEDSASASSEDMERLNDTISGLTEYVELRFGELELLHHMLNITLTHQMEELCNELGITFSGDLDAVSDRIDSISMVELENITRTLALLEDIQTSLDALSQLEEVHEDLVKVDDSLQKQSETSESSDDSMKTLLTIILVILIITGIIAVLILVMNFRREPGESGMD